MTGRDTSSPDSVRQLLDEAGVPQDAAVVRALLDIRALGAGPGPEASAELAQLMADGGRAPQGRRFKRRVTFIGGALAVSMGVGMSGVAAGTLHLPEGLGNAVGSITRFTAGAGDAPEDRSSSPLDAGNEDVVAPEASSDGFGAVPAPVPAPTVAAAGGTAAVVPPAAGEAAEAGELPPYAAPPGSDARPEGAAGAHRARALPDAPPSPARPVAPAVPASPSGPTGVTPPAGPSGAHPPVRGLRGAQDPGHTTPTDKQKGRGEDASGTSEAPQQTKQSKQTQQTKQPQQTELGDPGRKDSRTADPVRPGRSLADAGTTRAEQDFARIVMDSPPPADLLVLPAPVALADDPWALFPADVLVADGPAEAGDAEPSEQTGPSAVDALPVTSAPAEPEPAPKAVPAAD
ncbi:hypothetical protein FDK12_11500 [Arthrobacter sp. NamB2]|uniref:hypothetical protein n=1 Tax=Arthrobacter sp. NamB2 TaxID=2576035 RepID=UPI0010C96EFC|nr:hypothetical protein [Arthrobacter sp. NamB2]TKV27329.1 hypothetical protein FDK12_11500 [Arthrobacter sp. NamB2]